MDSLLPVVGLYFCAIPEGERPAIPAGEGHPLRVGKSLRSPEADDERRFSTRVFSHYGHYELAVLAGFCEKEDTYHVLPQYGYAELLDSNGKPVTQPGGMGEIVATSFIMHATPIIRYRTRDYAVLKGWQCPVVRTPVPDLGAD